MENKAKESVSIGDVTGGIHGSIIAGRDVKNATITIGDRLVPADKEPSIEEFQQLLAEIKNELAELAAQQEALQAITPTSPSLVQVAEANIGAVVDASQDSSEMGPEEANSVEQSLNQTTSLLSAILDSAKTVAGKAVEAGKAVAPIIEKLAPLVEKVGVAAFWATKLWPT